MAWTHGMGDTGTTFVEHKLVMAGRLVPQWPAVPDGAVTSLLPTGWAIHLHSMYAHVCMQ